MKILVAKSAWEVYEKPLDVFVGRILEEGYDAAEVYLRDRPEKMGQIRHLMRNAGLPLIAQIATRGDSPDDHIRNLLVDYEQALEAEPLFISSHTGSEWFSFNDNLRIFQAAEELGSKYGLPVRHETHRGRALFALNLTLPFLRALPDLRLTADFSHWFCVHEGNLENQQESLSFVMERARHIHARVGFDQGPQISDPRNVSHKRWLDRSMELWKGIISHAESVGETTMTITPEFGPPSYTPLNGISPEPVSDAWEMNSWMHRFLKEQLALT